MSQPTTLKLTKTQTTPPDSYLLERRSSNRRSVTMKATALIYENEGQEKRHRICPIQLVDVSTTGVRAIISEEISTESVVSVIFAPHGPEHGTDMNMSGRVVRCRQRGDVHEIGIQLSHRAAA